MARKTNPLTAVVRRLKKIQAKTDRLNEELQSFADFLAASMKKTALDEPAQKISVRKAAAKPAGKKSPADKVSAKRPAAGRPAKKSAAGKAAPAKKQKPKKK